MGRKEEKVEESCAENEVESVCPYCISKYRDRTTYSFRE